MSRLIAAPHPFKVDTINRVVPDGLTLAEMFDLAEIDPALGEFGHAWIGDQYVRREHWHVVRPKAGVNITLRVVPQDGGGGGKSPLRTVMMVAVIAASFYFGPALGGALGGISASAASSTMVFGSLSYAALGGAIIAVGGMLLVNAIAPIRPPGALAGLSGTSTQDDSPTLLIEGARNAVRPFGTVPVVLGVHRHVPPLGVRSYTEIVGDDHYVRGLVVWGYGPLKIENLRLGETPITDFDGVQIETREGRADDDPITLIPDTVLQDDFSILLQQVDGFQQRTAEADADELSVDITFPQGLSRFNDHGTRLERTVSMQIQFREVGESGWEVPAFTATTVPDAWISADTITFTQQRSNTVRHGFRWPVPTRGDYEVRMRRLDADQPSTNIFDSFAWTALRTIRNEDPLNFPFPLAVTAFVIKASNQLNRTVDELNADVSSYLNSYQGSASGWSEQVSANPADVYRHVLQGNANARGLPDARVDIDKLEEWSEFCTTNGFEFNMVRDFQSSVWDTLADIAAAGRASPAQVDGKWSVVYDYEQTIPVQHFTPRNSWGFEAEKSFPDQPHGMRIRFSNRDDAWRQDERIVYADGYDETNATDFFGLAAPGVTDANAVWKFGRFQIAQAILRPERWTFSVDFEHIVARRGDLVLVSHDVLLVGLAQGRIKSLTYDANSPPNVTGFVSDEVLTMESGTDYGVSIRNLVDIKLTSQIVTSAGDQTTVTFTAPLAPENAPDVGDLFGFGTLGNETIEGLILSIEPSTELSARVVCIPASPAIYDSDTGTIPAFDSKLTPLPTVPVADIVNVKSDESVLELGAGDTLIAHIGVTVTVPDVDMELIPDVQIRVSGNDAPYQNAAFTNDNAGTFLINNVEQGAYYDIRVRWRNPNKLPGVWTPVFNHRVVGQTTPPAALINANISVFGGQALIRWDRPSELDVRFGGEVQFRHSPEPDPASAAWQSSTSIGTAAKGDSLFASLPLKAGTYLARVFDKTGRPSTDVTILATKQASVLTFANVSTVTESPTFSGTKSGVVEDAGTLKLAGAGLFDDITDFDAVTDLDTFGLMVLSGTYVFTSGLDLGSVSKVRLTSNVDATSVNELDDIDERTANIDDWEDFDGTTASAANCRVQVRHTDDDPSGSPVSWSEWNNLDSAEFEARGFQFRALLSSDDAAYNIRVDTLGVIVEDI